MKRPTKKTVARPATKKKAATAVAARTTVKTKRTAQPKRLPEAPQLHVKDGRPHVLPPPVPPVLQPAPWTRPADLPSWAPWVIGLILFLTMLVLFSL